MCMIEPLCIWFNYAKESGYKDTKMLKNIFSENKKWSKLEHASPAGHPTWGDM